MRRTHNLAVAILVALAMLMPRANAQGCVQCLDNTASTSPATQRAYAHAIELVSGAAAILFLGALAIFKRHP